MKREREGSRKNHAQRPLAEESKGLQGQKAYSATVVETGRRGRSGEAAEVEPMVLTLGIFMSS